MSTEIYTYVKPPINYVYTNVKLMIHHTVRQHKKHYVGDWQDLMAEANYHFVRAYHSYRPGVGTLSGWIHYRLQRDLLETVRTAARRNACISRKELHMERVPQRRSFNLHAILAEVSDDARTILELVVGPHLNSLVTKKKSNKEPTAMRKRCYLIRFLREVGWTAERIVESFQEIKEILS